MPRSAAERRTSSAQVSEQWGREFASINQVAGACDEAMQISGPRPAFSLSLRDHYVTLQSGEDICLELAATEQ